MVVEDELQIEEQRGSVMDLSRLLAKEWSVLSMTKTLITVYLKVIRDVSDERV